jgi:hypothetical protein
VSAAAAILEAGEFLVEHADTIEEIVDALRAGATKDAIKAAIRRAAIDASDAAIREELGVK